MKLTGFFEKFPEIENIPFEAIQANLPTHIESHTLQNFIANRIIYPQTIASTTQDLDIDFVLLKLILSQKPNYFYDPKQARITLPTDIQLRFPPLPRLLTTLIQQLKLADISSVIDEQKNLLFNIISLQLPKVDSLFNLKLNNKQYSFARGSITILPPQKLPLELNKRLITFGKFGLIVHVQN